MLDSKNIPIFGSTICGEKNEVLELGRGRNGSRPMGFPQQSSDLEIDLSNLAQVGNVFLNAILDNLVSQGRMKSFKDITVYINP